LYQASSTDIGSPTAHPDALLAGAQGQRVDRGDGRDGPLHLEDDGGGGQAEAAHVLVERREVQAGPRGPRGDERALAADPLQQALADQLPDRRAHRDPADAVVDAELALAGEQVPRLEGVRRERGQDGAELLVLGHRTVVDAGGLRHVDLPGTSCGRDPYWS
jgi:hypothetical protein